MNKQNNAVRKNRNRFGRHEFVSAPCYKVKIGLINYEEMFANSPNARIINSNFLVSPTMSKDFTEAIMQNASTEVEFVPTCQCGEISGQAMNGQICPKCGTVCSTEFIDALEHKNWLSFPEELGIPKIMHPRIYTCLRRYTTYGRKNSIIDIILDPTRDVPPELEPIITGRGFQWLHDNFESVMLFLFNTFPKTAKKPHRDIELLLERYKDCIWTSKYPILDSSLHPVKKVTGTLSYGDAQSKSAFDAVINLSTLTFKSHVTTVSQKSRMRSLYNIYQDIIKYDTDLIEKKLSQKQGLMRKHCGGARMHNSARSVIIPHTRPMPMDEVLLPWAMVVNEYQLEIMNVLVNRKDIPFTEAHELIEKAKTTYSPMIHDIIRTLIKEAKHGRIALLLGRNPTLKLFSIMEEYFVDVKTDPKDQTISICATIIKNANMDFDGDEIYVLFIRENDMIEDLSTIHPMLSVLDTSSPGFSSAVGLLDQNSLSCEMFLMEEEEYNGMYKEVA